MAGGEATAKTRIAPKRATANKRVMRAAPAGEEGLGLRTITQSEGSTQLTQLLNYGTRLHTEARQVFIFPRLVKPVERIAPPKTLAGTRRPRITGRIGS